MKQIFALEASEMFREVPQKMNNSEFQNVSSGLLPVFIFPHPGGIYKWKVVYFRNVIIEMLFECSRSFIQLSLEHSLTIIL